MIKVLSFRFQQCVGLFTLLLFEGPLKQDFLDVYLTTFFGVRKRENTSAVTVILFYKILKFESKFPECKKK